MKRTMVWPPEVVAGKALMTPTPDVDPENQTLQQLVVFTVQDATSMNPWVQRMKLGIRDRAFSSARLEDRTRLEADIRERFGRLERQRRARLVKLDISFKDGELSANISYDDLERSPSNRRDLGVSLNG